MTDSADAVVVGAGHNGLVAANLLADAGWDVLVVEATPAPGGAVRSAEITVPGYISDLFSAFYPIGYASPVLRELGLERYGLRWTHAPDVLGHLFPDGRAAVLNRDPEKTAESLAGFEPGDGERWLRLYQEWLAISEPLLAAVLRPFPPVRPGLALLRRQAFAEPARIGHRFVMPARRLGAQLFRGEGATALLAGLGLHTDLGPDVAGSAGFGWLLAMVGQQYGFPVPVGGAQRLTDALVGRLRAAGGQLRCQAPVERILTARGTAAGVRCADGSLVRARRAVLCDVPAPALYHRLIPPDQLPPRLLSNMRGFAWDHAVLKLDWALRAPIPWTSEAVRGCGTLHLGGDVPGLSRYAGQLSAGDQPLEPFVVAGQLTTADQSRSPAGTEILWAYTHLPQRSAWDRGELAEQVSRVEQAFERHAPGFRDLIVGRHVLDPSGLESANPSLHSGAFNGGSAGLHQQLVFRPVLGLARADTPIDRLFLASASAHPGGGVHGAPGANAARAALARWRPVTGPAYRAAVRTGYRWLGY